MEPLSAALLDEACSYPESIGQVDGVQDSPLERPGKKVEVEGRLEVEEVSMTGWCQVRRKKGQVEKDVAAVSRGWEEYKNKFPHLAFEQRREWSEREVVKKWLAGGDEMELERKEKMMKPMFSGVPYRREVAKWLRGGGGQE